jgi:hypothetical protein
VTTPTLHAKLRTILAWDAVDPGRREPSLTGSLSVVLIWSLVIGWISTKVLPFTNVTTICCSGMAMVRVINAVREPQPGNFQREPVRKKNNSIKPSEMCPECR